LITLFYLDHFQNEEMLLFGKQIIIV
jgi:hypothetical protein